MKRLTEAHLRSIEMELRGDSPEAIWTALGVPRATWYRWSREPVYQAELQALRRRRLEEASDALGGRLSGRFRDLDEVLGILLELARDPDVDERDRIRACAEHGRLVCQSATLALGIAKATAPAEVEAAPDETGAPSGMTRVLIDIHKAAPGSLEPDE